jgi:putative spermidine/putrescine transport system substrate-binding protein
LYHAQHIQEETKSMSNHPINRRELLKRGAIGGIGLAGLGAGLGNLDLGRALASRAGDAPPLNPKLVAAAIKDGALNVITLPHADWANYQEIMDTFAKRYGIKITDDNPDGSSAQEIQAIINFKHQNRAPDVVDVSPVFALKGKQQGLYTPFKVSTWNTIPDNLKDKDGYYYGDYWGVVAFMSNNSVVKQAPKDWSDLLSPKLRNAVAFGGDPTKSGEAFAGVFAAALANGGSLDNIQPGIDFFIKLKKAGNFNPTFALPGNFAKGLTPVAIRWDYLLLASRDSFAGNPAVTVNVPKSGTYGGAYFQAINKYAPNPDAAKLWEEYLYSDEGQLLFLKGYTHPVRYLDLAKRNVIPAALAAKLPPAASYKNVQFATTAQITKANLLVQDQWKQVVG